MNIAIKNSNMLTYQHFLFYFNPAYVLLMGISQL